MAVGCLYDDKEHVWKRCTINVCAWKAFKSLDRLVCVEANESRT